jgi:hypothetical protein
MKFGDKTTHQTRLKEEPTKLAVEGRTLVHVKCKEIYLTSNADMTAY